MTTKERIKKAIDTRATSEHYISLAYISVVKDVLKKNPSLKEYVDFQGLLCFYDLNGKEIALFDYKGNQLVPSRPSFKPIVDFITEFPEAYIKGGFVKL